jgi:hypothetical protein
MRWRSWGAMSLLYRPLYKERSLAGLRRKLGPRNRYRTSLKRRATRSTPTGVQLVRDRFLSHFSSELTAAAI